MKIGLKEGILFVVVLAVVFVMGGIVMKAITTPVESGHVCNDDIGIPIPGSSPQKKSNPITSAQDNSVGKSNQTAGTIEGVSGPPPDPAQIVAGTNVKTVENNSVTNSLQTTKPEQATKQIASPEQTEEYQGQITVEEQRKIDEEYAKKTAGYHIDPAAAPPPQPEMTGFFISANGKLYDCNIYHDAGDYKEADIFHEFDSQPIKIVLCGPNYISCANLYQENLLRYVGKPRWGKPKNISDSEWKKLNQAHKKYAMQFTDSVELRTLRGPLNLSSDTYYFDLGVLQTGWYSFRICHNMSGPRDQMVFFHIR